MSQENLFTTDCIRTVSGIYVNVFDPEPEMFIIEDIAHALSMQCRFGGHLPLFYSVAEHCIDVSGRCTPENKFSGLMHDASEAYLLDIPSPIKKRLSNYKEIEDGVMKVISRKFGFDWPLTNDVKLMDSMALSDEWRSLMLSQSIYEHHYNPEKMRDYFLMAFKSLSNGR